MRVAIVGAGLTGLTAGFYLVKAGHQVFIFEKDRFLGGLASAIKTQGWYIERFFHHIFKSDKEIQKLAKDLGLEDLWFWKDSGAPVFYKGQIHPFTTPLDLLRFKPLKFLNRIRTGLISLYLLAQRDFHQFEGKNASVWLKKWMGEESFKVIWQPLMKKKFSSLWDKIAMTWMWARIHKRSRFLGYPKGGFQIIVEKLAEEIKKNGRIFLDREIRNINELKNFDKIIFTCAPQIFLQIVPQLPKDYFNQLKQIEYLGTIVVLLKLSKKLLEQVYWLNINDENIPFVVCVQQSNLVDPKNYNDCHWLYLGGYFPRDHQFFRKSNEEIVKEWITHLGKFNSEFRNSWIKEFFIFKEKYTQPQVLVGYEKIIPSIKTPLDNVYLANMSQVYPWDRGTNYAVKTAYKIVNLLK